MEQARRARRARWARTEDAEDAEDETPQEEGAQGAQYPLTTSAVPDASETSHDRGEIQGSRKV